MREYGRWFEFPQEFTDEQIESIVTERMNLELERLGVTPTGTKIVMGPELDGMRQWGWYAQLP